MPSSAPHCFILGATGFIGGQIARAAEADAWRVTGVRRRPDSVGAIGDLPITWVQADLDDREGLFAALRTWAASVPAPDDRQAIATGAGAGLVEPPIEPAMFGLPGVPELPGAGASRTNRIIFHCAGAYPHNPRTIARDLPKAVQQMRNVLDGAAEIGVDRLVYTSSYTTIGPSDAVAEDGIRRLSDERDIYVAGSSGDPYYEAKWAMESLAMEAGQNGQPVVVLCPTAVFGPGDVHMSVSAPLLQAARGRMPFYIDALLGVVDVRDVATAHLAAALQRRASGRYILNGHNTTLYAALAEMARTAGVRPPRIKIGPGLLKAVITCGQLAPGGQASFLKTISLWRPVSNARAIHDLGLTTRPLAETMADTLAWFRERGMV